MYLLSKQVPATHIIGICGDHLYAFHVTKNSTIRILRKRIVDTSGWKIFWNVNIKVPRSTCACHQGYCVSTQMVGHEIMFVTNDHNLRLFALNLPNKTAFFYFRRKGIDHLSYFCIKCLPLTIRNLRYGQNGRVIKFSLVMIGDAVDKNICFNRSYKHYMFHFAVNLLQSNYKLCFGHFRMNLVSNKEYNAYGDIFLAKRKNNDYKINIWGSFGVTEFKFHHPCQDLAFVRNGKEVEIMTRAQITADKSLIQFYAMRRNAETRTFYISLKLNYIIVDHAGFPAFTKTEIFKSQSYVIFATRQGILSLLTRVPSLSEICYLSLVRLTKKKKESKGWSVRKLKSVIGYPKKLPLVSPPKL